MALRALARVNLAAIERNAAAAVRAPGRGRRAVRGGQGAEPRGTARCRPRGPRWPAGRPGLAVATVGEAAELRAAGLSAPILIMGAISAEELPVALAADAEVVAWTERFVDDLARAAALAPAPRPTAGRSASTSSSIPAWAGWGRASCAGAVALAERLAGGATPGLMLAGAMTHFATADGDPEFVAAQLAAFAPFVRRLRAGDPGDRVLVHAANSAATLARAGQPFRHGALRDRPLRL